jgi:ABC-type antimicrobial peptide transport system permease subunit
VAIVGERLARQFSGSLIGQRLGDTEVVGVARDMRYGNIKDGPRDVVYYPLFQEGPSFYAPTFTIRYTGSVRDVLALAQAALDRIDSRLEMFRVRTLEQQTQDSISRERLLAIMTTYLGGFAVALACIGLYGLTSYTVSLRSAEIGVRMALGAQPRAVRLMIVREAAITVAAGVLAGLAGAFAAERVVSGQLFGVQPHDPIVLAGATALLVATAVGAAYLPARRASQISPINALRQP